MEQLLALEMVRVTEAAAIASARFMGRGEKDAADRRGDRGDARDDGRDRLRRPIVIGEGERDEAPMLYIGEQVGRTGADREDVPRVDIAVDPLEGTNLVAHGQAGAITVLAASEAGGLIHAPDTYMEKLCVGPGRGRPGRHPRDARPRTCDRIAEALGRRVADITVVILERPRHDALIAEVRAAGARIKLIGDGDLSAAISVRRLGHRRPRRDGHRRRAGGRHHRGRAALPRRRDPGPLPLPQRRGARPRRRGWATATRTGST